MLDAKTIYPDVVKAWELREGWAEASDYKPLIHAIGTPVVEVSDDDYQGDTRVLYHDAVSGKIGVLVFGWGSCSGCDALQGCENIDQLQALVTHVEQSVQWFDTVGEALFYMQTHDWGGDHSWSNDKTHDFLRQATRWLELRMDRLKSRRSAIERAAPAETVQ